MAVVAQRLGDVAERQRAMLTLSASSSHSGEVVTKRMTTPRHGDDEGERDHAM